MASSSPLLLLLDSVLSNDQDQVHYATNHIHHLCGSTRPSVESLSEIVTKLLLHFPQMASVQSESDGSLPLHFAASLGEVTIAKAIHDKYPHATSLPNKKGKIPLHYAAREGRTEMVQFLLHMNPTIASIKSKKDKLALHFACGDGHVDVVRALLRVHPEGAFISSQKGKLPLHFAARWGHGLIAEDLLRLNKKSAEHRDLEGSLPLHDAAREGQTAMSQFLLQQFPQGARVANLRGEIPLFPAIRSGNLSLVVTLLQAWPLGGRHILESIQESDAVHDWDWSIVELLLRGAAENFNGCPNIPSLGGECNCKQKSRPKSPIMDQETTPTAGETARNSSCFKKRALPTPFCDESTAANNKRRCTNTVRNTATTQLSRQQSQFRVQSQQNNSCRMRADESLYRCKFLALHTVLAVTNAPVQVLEIVLKRQCDLLHETDCRGQLPLHIAAAHCKEDEDRAEFIVKNLLCCPDDAKHRDSFGRIPLHIALEHQASFTLTKALLEAYPKSGVKMEDDEGMFPLRLAAERDCDLSTIYSLLRIDPSVLVVNHPV